MFRKRRPPLSPPPPCGVASLAAVLARASSGLGVPMRGYRLTSPSLLKPGDLGIVELTADHFVALVGRRGDAYEIVDSPDGKPHDPEPWSVARLEAEWTGNVLLVETPRHG